MSQLHTPDLCIIGAGTGGLAAARAARELGASVIVVERGAIGGGRLRPEGIAATTLFEAARLAQSIRDGRAIGVSADGPKIGFRRIHDLVEATTLSVAPRFSAEHLTVAGIEVMAGDASFIDKRTLQVGVARIRAHRFVIATGAVSAPLALLGLEGVPFFTPESILDNTRKLTHLVIICRDPRAFELGQAYRRLGSEVTLICEDGVALGADPEALGVIERRLAEEGVRLLKPARVVSVQGRSMGIGVRVATADGEIALDASHILVASERIPNIDGLGVEKLGLRFEKGDSRRLEIRPDGFSTSNPRVFVIGGAAGHADSAHHAEWQARELVRKAVLALPARVPANAVPHLLRTDPPFAQVGLDEATARKVHGLNYRVTRLPYADSDLARAERQTSGFVKLVTHRDGRILGATIAGSGAVDLAAIVSLALSRRLHIADLAGFVPPYPSHADLLRALGVEALRAQPMTRALKLWRSIVRVLG